MSLAMAVTVAKYVGFGLLITVIGLWGWNYFQSRDAPRATRKTNKKVIGFVSGAVFAFAAAINGFGEVVGLFGDFIAVFPGGFGQIVLGALAIGSFASVIELTVVTATILVVIVIFATAAVKY